MAVWSNHNFAFVDLKQILNYLKVQWGTCTELMPCSQTAMHFCMAIKHPSFFFYLKVCSFQVCEHDRFVILFFVCLFVCLFFATHMFNFWMYCKWKFCSFGYPSLALCFVLFLFFVVVFFVCFCYVFVFYLCTFTLLFLSTFLRFEK